MKLIVYGVKDTIANDFPFTFMQTNEGMMKRIVKGALMDKQPNVISSDLKDKDIFELGEFETSTGVIIGLAAPVFVAHVADIRLELIREIKIAKAEAGEEQPTAEEVVDE